MSSLRQFAFAAVALSFLTCSPASAQVFNTTPGNQIYEFIGTPTNDNQFNTVSIQPADASFSAFTRNTVTFASGANVFNSDDWLVGGTGIDTTRYVTFTITPSPGFQVDLQGLTFDVSRSGNGPGSGEVHYSTNGFATSTSLAYAVASSNTTVVWDFVDFSSTSAVAFRFYGYGAANAGGSMRFDNVFLTGGASPVPEPVHILLACGLVVAGGRGLRRLKRAKA